MSVVRHFTATAYVVHDGRVALHWHPKVKAWLPPGGHVEENEDPVRAVLRETEEETGLKTEVVPTGPAIDLSYPVIVQPPLTIMVEDIHGQYGAGRPASRAGPGQWPTPPSRSSRSSLGRCGRAAPRRGRCSRRASRLGRKP